MFLNLIGGAIFGTPVGFAAGLFVEYCLPFFSERAIALCDVFVCLFFNAYLFSVIVNGPC